MNNLQKYELVKAAVGLYPTGGNNTLGSRNPVTGVSHDAKPYIPGYSDQVTGLQNLGKAIGKFDWKDPKNDFIPFNEPPPGWHTLTISSKNQQYRPRRPMTSHWATNPYNFGNENASSQTQPNLTDVPHGTTINQTSSGPVSAAPGSTQQPGWTAPPATTQPPLTQTKPTPYQHPPPATTQRGASPRFNSTVGTAPLRSPWPHRR